MYPLGLSEKYIFSTAYRRGKSFLRLAFFQKRQGRIPPCKWGLGGIFAPAKTSVIWVPNIELATTEKPGENVDKKNTMKCLLVRLKNVQYEVGFMGENRKDNRQIKFRVSDHEYEELEQTANNFHMSVPAFAKKRALWYRMKPPKVDKSGAIEIAKQLRAI